MLQSSEFKHARLRAIVSLKKNMRVASQRGCWNADGPLRDA